jgi:hypothetical protein
MAEREERANRIRAARAEAVARREQRIAARAAETKQKAA